MHTPPPPRAARRGSTTFLYILIAAVLITTWAFSHHFTVLTKHRAVVASQASRRATQVAGNLVDQAPQLVQLALNGEHDLLVEASDPEAEPSGLSAAFRGLGMDQVLRVSLPPPASTIESDGVPIRIMAIEGTARFLELDGMEKQPTEETCGEFVAWVDRWNAKGG